MDKLTLSLCMIVKNEEMHLKNCLESIKDLVDEIIIVDTGSTDKTKEIASKFTNKIFDLEWNNHFSDARNFSISKASGNWILIMDADEVISRYDCNKIKELLKNTPADAFLLILRDYTNNTGVAGFISSKDDIYTESKIASGFYTSKILRLFRNNKNIYFEGRTHETINNSIKKIGGIVLDNNIVIHHFGNLDKKIFLEKKYRNIQLLRERLEKKEFKEKGEDRIYFELSRELVNINEFDLAICYLRRAVEIKKDFEYLLGLGGLHILKDELNDGEKILKMAVILNPLNSSVHDNLGIIYAKRKEYNKAIRKFERAIELNPKSADAYFNLGQVYREIGKTDKMKRCFNEAIELNPKYGEKINS